MGWLREALAGLLFGLRGLVSKELQIRSRGWRPMWLLTMFLLLTAVAITGSLALADRGAAVGPNVGTVIFAALAGVAVMLLAVITPALTVGGVSGERERQTLDLLLVTRGSPLGLVAGKLLAAVLYVLYLLVAALPAFSVVYLLGGVPPAYLLMVLAVAAATALAFASLGLLISALTRRTLLATVATYLLVLLLLLGVPLIWAISGGGVQLLAWTQPTNADIARVVLPPAVWAYFSPTVTMIAVLEAISSSSGAFGGTTATNALPLSQAAYTTSREFSSGRGTADLVIAWAPWVYQLAGSVIFALVSTFAAGLALAPIKPWQRWRRRGARSSLDRSLD